MTKGADKALARLVSSFQSGRITVRINNEDPMTLEISGDTITASINYRHFAHEAYRGMKAKVTEFRMLRRFSEVFVIASRRFDLLIDGRKVFSMGKGVKSVLGNEKVYFINLIRKK